MDELLADSVKDLEVELETTRDNCKENMQQATLIEKEKFTQMQWDLDELQKKCMATEQKLEYELAERARVESSKISIIQENEMLLQQLDATREQLENLHKHHEEFERVLQKEKQRMELANLANSKLLHECEILCNRLQECSVNFLSEEEDRLTAQLLAQDIEKSMAKLEETRTTNGSDQRSDDVLRKMVTDIFIDNARLRMQVNTVIRCALNMYVKSDEDEEEEETPLRKTVLSRFLQR
ncbi:hypothetical protein Patl1_34565 [Pistacia atlantica]|uniref:Uncharacterized protein n=1 Tax=Pistacia atlantica TaxID=434234 RepID=A0ACC0ZVB5_9ROSI|nr:hypothetical protein Patl1_34565 [Pistacia atlantica]